MKPKIHTYTSKEPMLGVNAFIIEGAHEIAIVDTTLTRSDSRALKKMADEIGKPVDGIILTHGHPDHVAGTINVADERDIPIYALESVKRLMEDTEQEKHKQWSGMFGDEWVPRWAYPNSLVEDGQSVKIAGFEFTVADIGSGGDSDANSLWFLDGATKAAFLGDFIYHRNHTYMADGGILRWIANLGKYADELKRYDTYYVGHGPSCDFAAIAAQKEYFDRYCTELLRNTNGSAVFTDESKKAFEQSMFTAYPDYGCGFMVGLAAEKVASELFPRTEILGIN
jgi:glyoxylase-like metal-dependent hydrolase (beta-lactamase superfamily II)